MNIIFCYYAVNTFSCPRADLKHTLPHLAPPSPYPPPHLPLPPSSRNRRLEKERGGISHLRSSHLVNCKVSFVAGNETLSCTLDACVCIKNNSIFCSIVGAKKKKKKSLKKSPTIHFTQGADTTGGPCAMVSPPPPRRADVDRPGH